MRQPAVCAPQSLTGRLVFEYRIRSLQRGSRQGAAMPIRSRNSLVKHRPGPALRMRLLGSSASYSTLALATVIMGASFSPAPHNVR